MVVRECAGKKKVVDYHINETTISDASKPADFSFFRYKELHPVGCEKARITRLGPAPDRGKENKKFLTRSLWLNNNRLIHIKGLDTFVSAVIESPEKISWIDFSFNYITKIDEVILQFKNLSIVYFHGNKISDIAELAKLRGLKKLRNITFHGNPISDHRNYRNIIIAYMPKIVHLDNQPVLKSERLEPLHPESLKHLKAMEDVVDKPKDTKDSPKPEPEKPETSTKTETTKKTEIPKKSDGNPTKSNDQTPIDRRFSRRGKCACACVRKLRNPVL